MRKIALFALFGLFALFLCLVMPAHAENQTQYLVTAWSYQPNNYVNKAIVSDLNGDGAAEVIASTRDGMVYCLGTKFKSHLNWPGAILMKGDVRALVVDDVDGDGKKETLIGTDSSQNNLKLLDWQGVNKDSFSIDFGQKVYSLDIGDADGDGKKDIVIGSSDAGVYVFGYDAEKPTWTCKTKGAVYYVRVSDLDGNGRNEVIAVSLWTDNELETAEVSAIDPAGKVVWTYLIDGGMYSYSTSDFDVADINGDGKQEIILGTSKSGVVVLGPDGKLLWKYDTGNLVSAIYPADLSKGKEKTILAGSAPDIYALDSSGGLLWKFGVNTTVYSFISADLNSDGKPEIVAGANKYLHVLTAGGQPIITQNRGIEIVGFGQPPNVKNVDARSVSYGDVDGDGKIEVVVGYGWTESHVDSNYYFGEVTVYKVNNGYNGAVPPVVIETTTSTTGITASTSSSTLSASATTSSSLPEKAAGSPTSTQPVIVRTPGESPLSAIVLVLLAALLISVVIIFLLYRRSKPKEVDIGWPPGQDI